MQFEKAILTNDGIAALGSATIDAPLTFTRMLFTESDEMLTQNHTALPTPTWGNGTIDSVVPDRTSGQFVINASASNRDSSGWAKGLGIYARGADGVERLMLVANSTGSPTYVSANSGNFTRMHFAITIKYALAADEQIRVEAAQAGLIVREEFEKEIRRCVTTHSISSESTGDEQTILGKKTFMDDVIIKANTPALDCKMQLMMIPSASTSMALLVSKSQMQTESGLNFIPAQYTAQIAPTNLNTELCNFAGISGHWMAGQGMPLFTMFFDTDGSRQILNTIGALRGVSAVYGADAKLHINIDGSAFPEMRSGTGTAAYTFALHAKVVRMQRNLNTNTTVIEEDDRGIEVYPDSHNPERPYPTFDHNNISIAIGGLGLGTVDDGKRKAGPISVTVSMVPIRISRLNFFMG